MQVRGDRESDKAHRSVPTSCLDPLEWKVGFSHMSIFSQSAERAARAAPNGVKKGATFLLVFRCLNHTASSRKAFNGVQKGQGHSKKHKPSKKYFCGWSISGSPPAGLNCVQNLLSKIYINFWHHPHCAELIAYKIYSHKNFIFYQSLLVAISCEPHMHFHRYHWGGMFGIKAGVHHFNPLKGCSTDTVTSW